MVAKVPSVFWQNIERAASRRISRGRMFQTSVKNLGRGAERLCPRGLGGVEASVHSHVRDEDPQAFH